LKITQHKSFDNYIIEGWVYQNENLNWPLLLAETLTIFSARQLNIRKKVQTLFQSNSTWSRRLLVMPRAFAFTVSLRGRIRALETRLVV